MSTDVTDEKIFCVDRAKQGRAACKRCKEKCPTGELRIAKFAPSPFGEGKMKNWYHVHCMFEQFLSQRVTTKRIESSEDLDGWDSLNDDDQNELLQKIEEGEKDFIKKHGSKYIPKNPGASKTPPSKQSNNVSKQTAVLPKKSPTASTVGSEPEELKVWRFRDFRTIVTAIANVDGYIDKTNIVKDFFTKNGSIADFKGSVAQWCRLLLPGVIKRIYNLQNKQLIKLFSRIFSTDLQSMTDSLNQGDIGETIQNFFEQSTMFKPSKKSTLMLQEVDDFLEELSRLTKEEDQLKLFQNIARKCTSNDLKFIIRLVKHDLRMNAGAKHILQAVHADAYEAYQICQDLDAVVSRFVEGSSSKLKHGLSVMTPVKPMLAEACKSIEQAFKKCPNGIYSEVKYDGERVQVHKNGSEFKYFSRSLKPVLHHKIAHFEKFIPEAFPEGGDLILDSEILMIDVESGQPLPFGTLGVHKKSEFQNANVCLFVFDCIYYNGESLIHKPLDYRKEILSKNMTPVQNRVVLAEMETIRTPKQLSSMIARVFELGLEGLVLKDIKSIYEPGKRHWLKVKKDYLLDGAMADTADLIVLGAWYGTGRKAGMKSVFLMGCYNENTKQFCTVTKVHTGHDDKTLDQLQKELEMDEIGCDYKKVPNWLNCNKPMTPDFVARDPRKQPIWEITGAEFTQHEVHTADGISIRFPRVTRIRTDKTWETATSLEELKNLFRTSKESTDFKALMKVDDEDDGNHKVCDDSKNIASTSYASTNKTDKGSSKNQPDKATLNSKNSISISSKNDTDNGSTVNAKHKTANIANTKGDTKFHSKSKNKRKHDTEDSEPSPSKIQKVMDMKRNNTVERGANNEMETKCRDKKKVEYDSKHNNNKQEIEIPNKPNNIFKDVLLLLQDGADEIFEKWLKDFSVYGGTILDSKDHTKATHVLHLESSIVEQTIQCSNQTVHITLQWLKDSIANNKLQNVKPYMVMWEPECIPSNDT